jgi:hypothetical protein
MSHDLDDLTAFDYAALRQRVRQDALAGDVVVHDGWILTRAEYERFVVPRTAAADDETPTI